MDVVIVVVLGGLFLLLILWLVFMNSGSSSSQSQQQKQDNLLKTDPKGPHETSHVQSSSQEPSKKFRTFVEGLFRQAEGHEVDMEESIKGLVELLCTRNEAVEEILKEYAEELRLTSTRYETGIVSSEWSGKTSERSGKTSEKSVSEQFDKLRCLAGKLNSSFEKCVTYENGLLGVFFGILSTSVVNYGLAVKKGENERAEEIKKKVYNYIDLIGYS